MVCVSTRLPFPGGGDIYQNREAQRVDLRRHNSVTSPTGLYRCDIPTNAVYDDTDISVRATVYVGLYTGSGGGKMTPITPVKAMIGHIPSLMEA